MEHGFTIRTVTHGPEMDDVRTLLRAYVDHLSLSINPALLRHREDELAQLPGDFVAPNGTLLLASLEGASAGCIAVRPVASTCPERTAELCRLWVSPHARGRRLGSHLVQAALVFARRANYAAMVLNTVPGVMDAAQSLYMHVGFRRVPAYKPVAIPGIVFYRLDLKDLLDKQA